MTTEAAAYDEELTAALIAIESSLNDIERGSTATTNPTVMMTRCQRSIKEAQTTLRHFRVEVRSSSSSSADEAMYNRSIAKHSKRLEELRSRFESIKQGGGASSSAPPPLPLSEREQQQDPHRQQAHSTANRILSIQEQAYASALRAETTVVETQGIADEAQRELLDQTQRMKAMNKNLDELDSEVGRAKSELNAFIRRMMTDKIMLCCVLLIVIGIVTVLVLYLHRSGDDDEGGNPPPPPAPNVVPPPPPPPSVVTPTPRPSVPSTTTMKP